MSSSLNTTTLPGLSPTMVAYYAKQLLERVLPKFVHGQWAQTKPLPTGNGKTQKFRKYGALPVNTEPLVEGVTPAGKLLSMTEIEATVRQYGDFIPGTDALELTAMDPVLSDSVNLLADQAAESLDQVVREVLHQGTSVQYAGDRMSRGEITAEDTLTVAEVRKAVRTLEANNASRIGDSFVAIIDPYTKYDIMNDEKWEDAAKYAGSSQIFEGEIGRIHGVRFVSTTAAKVFEGEGAEGIDVHSTLFLGADAYGIIPLDAPGHDSQWSLGFIFHPKGSAGAGDPLNQRWTAGWKVAGFAAKILQPLFLLRVESAASE